MMKKSDKNIKEINELPKRLDYSVLPREIEEAVQPNPYEIEKETKLSWDGKQFMVRIPLDISEEMGITQKNKGDFKVRFKLVKSRPKSDEVTTVTMELIKWAI